METDSTTTEKVRYRSALAGLQQDILERLEASLCPFCGTPILVVQSTAHGRTLFDLCCDDCLWQTNSGFYTVDAAIKWANTRAET